MKKLLSRADGSVEMVYKKVPDTSHVFTTKMAIKSSAWVGHLKPISPPGREFEQTNLHKFRWLEGCPKKGGGGGSPLNDFFELIEALLSNKLKFPVIYRCNKR